MEQQKWPWWWWVGQSWRTKHLATRTHRMHPRPQVTLTCSDRPPVRSVTACETSNSQLAALIQPGSRRKGATSRASIHPKPTHSRSRAKMRFEAWAETLSRTRIKFSLTRASIMPFTLTIRSYPASTSLTQKWLAQPKKGNIKNSSRLSSSRTSWAATVLAVHPRKCSTRTTSQWAALKESSQMLANYILIGRRTTNNLFHYRASVTKWKRTCSRLSKIEPSTYKSLICSAQTRRRCLIIDRCFSTIECKTNIIKER